MIQLNIREHMLSIYATPISNYLWPDVDELNQNLRELILQYESNNPGITRSNVGGWHSDLEFLQTDKTSFRELHANIKNYVIALFRAVSANDNTQLGSNFKIESWANVLRYDQYNSLHSHPNSFWSGVYYVTGNKEPEAGHPFSGKLELIDPRPGASLSYADQTNMHGRYLFNPVPGQMIVFPGWLQHQVHPYFGADERISIAFNTLIGE